MTVPDYFEFISRQTTPGYRPAPESVEWEEVLEAVTLETPRFSRPSRITGTYPRTLTVAGGRPQ
jgi:hypothetical protein